MPLADFTYPAESRPHGVIDTAMPASARAAIDRVAAAVHARLSASGDWLRDCRHATAAWREFLLREAGVNSRMLGGEGVDDDVFAGYRLVPHNDRSGYLESDGLVHRHYWLIVEPGGFLFDPTAHQFDARGGVQVERYIVDGVPLRAHDVRRTLPRTGSRRVVSPPSHQHITPSLQRRPTTEGR